uniref:MADF domain-containing protein n=1 Tax=Biomphalaria glabrata TaxID=6526 RepID=A0A2C9KJU0_BIOGL
MSQLNWTRMESLHLIEAYRKSMLWHSEHGLHLNKISKEELWREVGSAVQKPVRECKKKMEYLLSGMRREKMKFKRSQENGDELPYKSSWFAFESLKFLWEKDKYSLSSLEHDKSTSDFEKDHETDTKIGCLEAPAPAPPPAPLGMTRKKRKKLMPRVHLQEKSQRIEASSFLPCVQQDECYHFGNLVAFKLRAYDDNIRCAIQNDIMNIFLRANQGFYKDIFSSPAQDCTSSLSSSAFHVCPTSDLSSNSGAYQSPMQLTLVKEEKSDGSLSS